MPLLIQILGLAIGLPPIINFGSDYLKRKVVADCLAGKKTICLAITEPYAGSDVANLKCEARESVSISNKRKLICHITFFFENAIEYVIVILKI